MMTATRVPPPTAEAAQPGADDEVGADADDGGDAGGDLEEAIDDIVDNLDETQAAQGGGSATLVVGDQEWTFDRVL